MSKQAPLHLRPATRRWWASVVKTWDLEAHHCRLLTLACEAFDRSEEAREQVAREGLTVLDRFEQVKPHPCAAIERDAKVTFARLLRELDLDVDAPAEANRPPVLQRYRGGAA